jgi:hypothetical protein
LCLLENEEPRISLETSFAGYEITITKSKIKMSNTILRQV